MATLTAFEHGAIDYFSHVEQAERIVALRRVAAFKLGPNAYGVAQLTRVSWDAGDEFGEFHRWESRAVISTRGHQL